MRFPSAESCIRDRRIAARPSGKVEDVRQDFFHLVRCEGLRDQWSTQVFDWDSSGDEVEDHDFSTFEKVHAQRADIEGKVRARAMPPAGRPQLTQPERRTLLAWIGCRAPEN